MCLVPSHVKDGFLFAKTGAKQSLEGLFLKDQKDDSPLKDGSQRGSNMLDPLDESAARNMSFTSLATNQISMIPLTGGSERSEDLLSEEWDNTDNNEVCMGTSNWRLGTEQGSTEQGMGQYG